MARHVVASTADIPNGGNKVVTIEGREIVVFHIKGEFFALLNRCPHEGGPMDRAQPVAKLDSDGPGNYRRSREGEFLRCPWHGWEFDVRTGQSYFDPRHCKVRAYPVEVADGKDILSGPYVAEVFPVTIDRNYVLVDV
ncbi:MAG: Rieske (2Fe-2S) protein [Hyphomicrobiaceae bacterium]